MKSFSLKIPQLLTLGSVLWSLTILILFLLWHPQHLSYEAVAALVAMAQLPGAWIIGKYLQRSLIAFIGEARKLEQGDLTIHFSNDSLCWCFNSLAGSLNNAIRGVGVITANVVDSGQKISSAIKEIQDCGDSVTSVLSKHVAETDQLATAMQEMSSAASNVAHDADTAAKSAESADSQGKAAKSAVDASVASISTLDGEVGAIANHVERMTGDIDKISNVLSVIGVIAEQTNLLALNAAIEAARAGDQGRGFAVVADEVRSLAAKTQGCTTEINEMLGWLRTGSDELGGSMQRTRQSFEDTRTSVAEVHQRLDNVLNAIDQVVQRDEQMASAAEEQSSVAQEISLNINNIREMAMRLQQLNSGAEDARIAVSSAKDAFMVGVGRFRM